MKNLQDLNLQEDTLYFYHTDDDYRPLGFFFTVENHFNAKFDTMIFVNGPENTLECQETAAIFIEDGKVIIRQYRDDLGIVFKGEFDMNKVVRTMKDYTIDDQLVTYGENFYPLEV